MTYGVDISGKEIRWVKFIKEAQLATCDRLLLKEEVSAHLLKQSLKSFFVREKVRRFVFAVHGPRVRAKLFPSDKVDISELEDHIAWEARFMLEYDETRDVLSFDPLRSVGNETWIVAAAAPRDEIKRKLGLFPASPTYVDTALTALANVVLRSKWGKQDLLALHLDRTRAFLVVISHGNPILMQEIENVGLVELRLDKKSLTWLQEELRLRRNLLAQDKRSLDRFLLSGEAALIEENAKALGERVGLPGEVFNPFDDVRMADHEDTAPLYSLAYACALRGEE
ncbi:hypothetical protein JXM67_05520 [candidate division WOR-3 bacterium]|nr:hypothetical protein [candidate division WOR-3 bacterium]